MTEHTNKKIALVTGASRGIGRAVALELARQDVHVVALARTVGALEALDDEIAQAGGSCTLVPQDLLKLEELDSLGPLLLEKFGRLDILIGNAGMLGTLGPLAHADPKEFQKIFDINVSANYRLLRTLDPLLKQSDHGQVVMITTSEGAMAGRAYWGLYGASKAALQSMTRAYGEEVQNMNVNVQCFNPGATRTRMRAAAAPGEDPDTLPTPEEVAERIVKLFM